MISTRWLADPIKVVAIFLVISGVQMNILFIIKVKILMLIK